MDITITPVGGPPVMLDRDDIALVSRLTEESNPDVYAVIHTEGGQEYYLSRPGFISLPHDIRNRRGTRR